MNLEIEKYEGELHELREARKCNQALMRITIENSRTELLESRQFSEDHRQAANRLIANCTSQKEKIRQLTLDKAIVFSNLWCIKERIEKLLVRAE